MSRSHLLTSAVSLIMVGGLLCVAVSAQSPAPATTHTLPATSAPEQAGSTVLAVGSVTDTAGNGTLRQLHDGDAIYSGDAISTGDDSYADLTFEDGGRMLLRPNTDFQIQQYHYDPAAHAYALAPPTEPNSYAQTAPAPGSVPIRPPPQPAPAPAAPTVSTPAQTEHESALFRLLKGGLSAISGFIGHVEHQDYALETPVATIGIRGTGYEVRYCDSGCATGQQGLYTGVGAGTISVRNQAGESLTSAGHYGYLQNRHALFTHLQYPPRALARMRLPQRYRQRAARNFRLIQQHRLQHWRNAFQFRRRAKPDLRAHPYTSPHGMRSAPPARRPPAVDYRTQHHERRLRKRRRHPPFHRLDVASMHA